MCVIVYKPSGIKLPTKKILKLCWDKNSDGAGYAYWNTNKQIWFVEKGFLKWKHFWKSYKEKNFQKEDCIISHFRIGTSGIKNGALCTHPFLIHKNCSEMNVLKFKSNSIVFHNGIIGKGEKEYSDTQIAIRDVIDFLYDRIDDKRCNAILEEVLNTNSNKWIITKENTIHMYGTFQEKDEIKFSNLNWEPFKPTSSYPTHYNNRSWQSFNNPEPKDVIKCYIDKSGEIYIQGDETNQDIEFDLCPNCFEDKYITDSSFTIGNCTCLSCGAVFTSETGEVHLFDDKIITFKPFSNEDEKNAAKK